jgi:polysaccharide pyruvyl transferase WcaK-like protein
MTFSLQFEDWAAMLDLYRHASASLNSRLHSGVLSLAAGRPTVYLSADMKFEDLMKSVNLTDFMVVPTV